MAETDQALPGELEEIPAGALALYCDIHLSQAHLQPLREQLQEHLPGRKVIIFGPGMRLASLDDSARLTAIERKLDVLIDALAEEGSDEAPLKSLDGELFGAARYLDQEI